MTLTASEPRERALRSLSPHGFHRVVWHEWGDPSNPRVVICVHGLTRNGRDFDVLGEALAPTHRTLAIDLPGRGRSEWLPDPADYVFPTYLTALTALLAASGADSVDWVGTSLGGLLGMVFAAQRGSPVARLVLNDVGPAIEPEALARIREYVGADVSFASYAEIEAYVRAISAPFGALSDQQWAHLTATSVRRCDDGRWVMAYDPGIAVPFAASASPANLWPLYDAIRCPTLLLRGAQSDLLSEATAAAMVARGPRPHCVTFERIGHAPALFSPAQLDPVLAFLRD